jgi:hypothetical protein
MHETLKSHLDNILTEHTKESDVDALLLAKESYFQLTGVLHEDDDDYEGKMNRFNFWYLFDNIPAQKEQPPALDYLENSTIEENVKNSLLNIRHSLFEYVKLSFKKQVVLRDLISNKKISLAKNHPSIGMLEGDLFSGRLALYEGENFVVGGQCLYPPKVKGILKKQAKKTGKIGSTKEEEKFLLICEHLKTKGIRYGHIDLEKIFVFDR